MMSGPCEEYREDWSGYVLGSLDAVRARELEAHLATGCSACHTEHDRTRLLVSQIALTVPVAQPSANVEAALKARLTAPPAPPVTPKVVAITSRKPASAWPAWFTAAAALALSGWFAWDAAQWRQRYELKQPVVASVAPTPAPPPVTPVPAPAVATPEIVKVRDTAAEEQLRAEFNTRLNQLREQLESTKGDQEKLNSEVTRWRTLASEAQSRIAPLEASLREARQAATQRPTPPPPVVATTTNPDLDRLRREAERLSRQLAEYRSVFRVMEASDLRQVDLRKSDPSGGAAAARALWSPSAGLVVLAHDLPRLPAGKCYQLWAVRRTDNAIISAGILETDASGHGVLLANPSVALTGLTAFSVTDEPAGGSTLAKGRKLLFGAL